MQSHDTNDRHGTLRGRPDHGDMITFTATLPRWPLLTRLWGRNALVRKTDWIESVVFVLAVAVSLLTVPVALALGTAAYDARHESYGSAAVEAVAISASVLVGVVSTMAAVVVITRGLCNRIRSAQWQRSLDSLVDHGDGQPRRQP